jgi:ubiquinone/menaquinone biosynthesis C-methylase UbiE
MARSPSRVHHPVFARLYERVSEQADRRGADRHRAELVRGLSGRVIEVGAGNGRNFAHYPRTVTEVVAVEPESRLRESALKAAAAAPVAVNVVNGLADDLPSGNGAFDAAVASLVLCTVPDQDTALRELRRAVRPGGELRFYEHVASQGPVVVRLQQALDRGVWPRVAGGCHLARDTVAAIERAGFRIESCRRFGFSDSALSPPIAHALGTARRV